VKEIGKDIEVMVNRLAEMGKNALNNVESKLKEFENSNQEWK